MTIVGSRTKAVEIGTILSLRERLTGGISLKPPLIINVEVYCVVRTFCIWYSMSEIKINK